MAISVSLRSNKVELVDNDPVDGLKDGIIFRLDAVDTVDSTKVAYYDRQVSITPQSAPAITQTLVNTEKANLLASVHDTTMDAVKTVQTWLEEQVAAYTPPPVNTETDVSTLPA